MQVYNDQVTMVTIEEDSDEDLSDLFLNTGIWIKQHVISDLTIDKVLFVPADSEGFGPSILIFVKKVEK
jgi:hypothetical protein